MPLSHSEARVSTDRPARYGKQLVAHMGRRNGGEWLTDPDRGSIVLANGRADLTCAPDALVLRVEGEDDALDQLEDVVGRHLVRFGTRDELVVSWIRADGERGTEQRLTGD